MKLIEKHIVIFSVYVVIVTPLICLTEIAGTDLLEEYWKLILFILCSYIVAEKITKKLL